MQADTHTHIRMLKILNHNSYLYSQVWYDMPLILWRQRQADLCKLEATLITQKCQTNRELHSKTPSQRKRNKNN